MRWLARAARPVRVMMTSDVATARRKAENPSASVSTGDDEKPPPTPKKPVSAPTANPATMTRAESRPAGNGHRVRRSGTRCPHAARCPKAARSMTGTKARISTGAGDRRVGDRAEQRARLRRAPRRRMRVASRRGRGARATPRRPTAASANNNQGGGRRRADGLRRGYRRGPGARESHRLRRRRRRSVRWRARRGYRRSSMRADRAASGRDQADADAGVWERSSRWPSRPHFGTPPSTTWMTCSAP